MSSLIWLIFWQKSSTILSTTWSTFSEKDCKKKEEYPYKNVIFSSTVHIQDFQKSEWPLLLGCFYSLKNKNSRNIATCLMKKLQWRYSFKWATVFFTIFVDWNCWRFFLDILTFPQSELPQSFHVFPRSLAFKLLLENHLGTCRRGGRADWISRRENQSWGPWYGPDPPPGSAWDRNSSWIAWRVRGRSPRDPCWSRHQHAALSTKKLKQCCCPRWPCHHLQHLSRGIGELNNLLAVKEK